MNVTQEPHVSFDLTHYRPMLVVISGPSGVGKDAVVRSLQRRGLPLHFVVTMTDRAPREGEVNGVDYFFVSTQVFEQLIAENGLIEYARVYSDYKGIPRSQIRDALASGKDVILRVDVQGAATVRRLCPDALLIFLLPENEEEWLRRLLTRRTETPETLAVRVQTVQEELKHLEYFDYAVVNAHDRLEQTVDMIVSILQAEHLRIHPREISL